MSYYKLLGYKWFLIRIQHSVHRNVMKLNVIFDLLTYFKKYIRPCCVVSSLTESELIGKQCPSLQRLRKPTLLSIAYLDKGSSLRSQNEQSKRRKEGTWECCKEVSHRLWTETYYGHGYRSGCPDNGGEMGSLSIVDELFLFRGCLTFRHIFMWPVLNWWHTQTERRRYAMSIKSTMSRG